MKDSSIESVVHAKNNATIKICKFCQKEFECSNRTPNKVFCSDDCSKSFYRNRYKGNDTREVRQEKRLCKYCGKEFIWSSAKSGQKYCSNECLQAYYSRKYEEKYPKEGRQEERNCQYCGKLFIWTREKSGQKYCSKECATAANDDKLRELTQNVWSEIRRCDHCGRDFEWFSNKPNQKYCGEECRHEAALIKIKNYNKSKNPTDEQLRNAVYLKVLDIISKMDQSKGASFNGKYIDYSVIGDISEKTREIVLERDRHECQVCKRKDSLQLHHLIKRRYGGSHKPENLITLCASCHRHIETGDIAHATNKCLKNAKRYYDATENSEALDIDVLRDKLIILFEKLKASSVGEESEIMIYLDDALDLIDK